MKWLLVVAGVLALGLAAWWVYSRRLPATKRGMKQWAQNPASMRKMNRTFAEREGLLARAKTLSDAELREGLESLLSSDVNARNTWTHVFEAVGSRAEPHLLRAFTDPRCESSQASELLKGPSAFEAVTRTLAAIGSSAVIERLAPWGSSGDERKQKHAALCIAATGRPEAVEPTRWFLRSDKEYVRKYALMGIAGAVKREHMHEMYRSSLFVTLESAIGGGSADSDAYRVIVDLDEPRGVALLSSPRVLREENQNAYEALRVLTDRGRAAPLEQLLPLLSRAKADSDYPWTYLRAECVRALARASPQTARPEVDAALDSDDETVRHGGTEALRLLLELPNPYDLLSDESSFESRPKPVQHVVAAIGFQAEVNNGGISQYFFNSAGDHWPAALEGFRAMGATDCAEILDRALKFVGPKVASHDRDTRIRAYAKLSDEREKELDELSSRFFDDNDRLDRCIVLYMAAHAALIRAYAQQLAKPSNNAK